MIIVFIEGTVFAVRHVHLSTGQLNKQTVLRWRNEVHGTAQTAFLSSFTPSDL